MLELQKGRMMRKTDSETLREAGGHSARLALVFVIAGMCCGWSFLIGAAGAWSQEAAAEPASDSSQEEGSQETKADTSWTSKVSIHGYLSQAYAFSDGNQILGIPEDGTADYRTAALQIRADLSKEDTFAVQFSHERNGLSPSQRVREDVDLDWIFYRRQFGNSAIEVGRVPVPFGIYNEVRDVGTLLPFYRPPRDFYGEGSFSTETVDGVLLSHGHDLGASWHFDGDVYYGNWDTHDGRQDLIKASDTLGAQLFLDTPLSGLRLGLGAVQFDTSQTVGTPQAEWSGWHGSIQGTFGRVEGAAEYRDIKAERAAGGKLYDVKVAYVHLGVQLTEKLFLNGQYEQFKLKLASLGGRELDYDEDKVLGLAVKFRPDLVLKAEYHWDEGYYLEPSANPLLPAKETNYGILSLSTSF
jgi:hypothetical protein